jgi:ribosomal protein S12 methylthiotransferase accessory factor
MDVVVWELTSDTGIPVFQCLILEREDTPTRELYAAMGMGCHPTAGIALLRALTEAAQSRLTLIAGSRDDVFRDEYRENSGAIRFLRHQKNLMKAGVPRRDFAGAPGCDFDTFNQDLDWLLGNLTRAGVRRVIAIDLTRPEFGIPVVRVVVPRLESFSQIPGYRPGPRAQAFAGAQL